VTEPLRTILRSTVCEFDLKEHSFREIPLDEFTLEVEQKNKVYWVHCDLNQPGALAKVSAKLLLPEHILEWCTHIDKTPKLIDDEVSLTVQIQCLLFNELNPGEDPDFESLIIYLTENFCFTASVKPIPALFLFIRTYPKALRYAKTSCFMLFLILDNVINEYSRILLDFQLTSDRIDLETREVKDTLYDEVTGVKKQVMKSKRYISTLRDTLMRISTRKIPVISKECRLSLRNLFNHSQMLFIQFDSIKDSLNSTLDQIDNFLMQKMNNTMKVLTAFAAIFLPLSLIAGIYGMNFSMPEYTWRYGYLWPIGLMIVCGGILIWIFKRKHWF